MRFWGFVASGFVSLCALSASAASHAAQLPALERGDHSMVRLRLAATPALQGDDQFDRRAVADSYGCRRDGAIWTTADGYGPAAKSIIAELKKAGDWGLDAAEFAVPELAAGASVEERAAAEQKLVLAILKYARHARGGRIYDPPVQLASYVDRKPLLPNPGVVLQDIAAAAEPDAYLRAFHPQHPEFDKLRQEYLRVRKPGAADQSNVRIPAGTLIRVGIAHPHVPLLRQRLKAPSLEGVEADIYDEALADKVREFQRAHGLNPSGTVGKGTRQALNNALDDNTDQTAARRLLANMEQWRWMPANLGDLHIWVSVPEFMVRVVKNGKVIHAERVVTGKTESQTPVFSDQMKSVVFQPQWGVPDSIKVNEILPRLLAGGGLRRDLRMQRNGKDIDPDDVNWNKANILEYHIFQPSGDDNALGEVKFLFPNKHQVYMHDTPSKRLFNEVQRTYSHGCVRVRNPVRLAEIIMAEDKGWSVKKVRELAWDGPQNNKVTLSRDIPVHITYFTAATDDNGKLRFHRDVYGHENRVALALEGKWKQIPRLPDHLAPIESPVAQKGKARQVNDEDEQKPKKRSRRVAEAAAAEEAQSAPPAARAQRRAPQVVSVAPPARVTPPPQAVNYQPRGQFSRTPPPPPQLNFFQKVFGTN